MLRLGILVLAETQNHVLHLKFIYCSLADPEIRSVGKAPASQLLLQLSRLQGSAMGIGRIVRADNSLVISDNSLVVSDNTQIQPMSTLVGSGNPA